MVHELLLRGARVSAKGRKGQTALDCARKRSEIMALLGAAASGGKQPLPALLSAAMTASENQASSSRLSSTSDGSIAARAPVPPPSGNKSVPAARASTSSNAASGSSHPPAPSGASSARLVPAPSSLSAVLQTLQNYSLPLNSAQYSAATGTSGSQDQPTTLNSPLTSSALARISASGPSAPQLLAQLQDALSSAMKSHGLDSPGVGDLSMGGQCSLQPGRIFGHHKCLQPASNGDGGRGGGRVAGDDKLLYMYCSNNCAFQFHAPCWKVNSVYIWIVSLASIDLIHSQVAKERLKQLFPKFTGFSANRGESSMLPCLSGDCGDGVIDEVFMGTAQSCMELYRMKPPAAASGINASEGKPWQVGDGQRQGRTALLL